MTPKPVHCEYIATLIQQTLLTLDSEKVVDQVSLVHSDFDAYQDYCATTKTIDVMDMNAKMYRITVQEL